MLGDIVIFSGPTIQSNEITTQIDAICLPPAMLGDVVSAMEKYKPKAIGLIDGYYENVPSVWHKEILHAISSGIQVYGSASMGALRAAELSDFGMIGIGKIFQLYSTGILEDDDEVAVLHGPKDLTFPKLSEAMINFRITFDLATDRQLIDITEANSILSSLKEIFYKDRSLLKLKQIMTAHFGEPRSLLLSSWLTENFIDQKKIDALEMVRVIKSNSIDYNIGERAKYSFFETSFFESLVSEIQH